MKDNENIILQILDKASIDFNEICIMISLFITHVKSTIDIEKLNELLSIGGGYEKKLREFTILIIKNEFMDFIHFLLDKHKNNNNIYSNLMDIKHALKTDENIDRIYTEINSV